MEKPYEQIRRMVKLFEYNRLKLRFRNEDERARFIDGWAERFCETDDAEWNIAVTIIQHLYCQLPRRQAVQTVYTNNDPIQLDIQITGANSLITQFTAVHGFHQALRRFQPRIFDRCKMIH